MSLLTIALVFSVAFGAAFTLVCPDECPTYWTSYDGYCYRLFGTGKTWHHAEGQCRRSVWGRTPHLVSIHNSRENAYIKRLMETAEVGDEFSYWIGLNELHSWSGQYSWSDGSRKNYQYWRPGEPNNYEGSPEYCVEFWKGEYKFGWNDSPCSNSRSYICKMSKSRKN